MKGIKILSASGTALDRMSGKLEISMTNDVLFHIVMQNNNEALKGLIEALLGLAPGAVKSAVVQNPIRYGDRFDLKEIVLDVLVLLNDNQYINIEMQVRSFAYWTNRAVFYLCRVVSDQNIDNDYRNLKPVIHIGIMDYTLFRENPSFYAEYYFTDTVRNQRFTDAVSIRVLDLTRMELADTSTENGRRLLQWAEAFKAATWEEIRAASEKDDTIGEAAKTMCAAISDEETRRMIRMREDAMRDWMTQVHAREDAEREAEKAKQELMRERHEREQAQKQAADAQKQAADAQKEAVNARKQAADAQKQAADAQKKAVNAQKQASDAQKEVADAHAEIDRLRRTIQELRKEGSQASHATES